MSSWVAKLSEDLKQYCVPEFDSLLQTSGALTAVVGTSLRAVGVSGALGGNCSIDSASGAIAAEIVGFVNEQALLMPLDKLDGVVPNASVRLVGKRGLPAAQRLLGRVVDGLARPQDDAPCPPVVRQELPWFAPINPLARSSVIEPLDTGIRAVNALLTVGVGQRVGLFAGSGVGKSVLLGMLARNTQADVVIVGLVGERGREIGEFVERNLGAAKERAVVVSAPADSPPVQRLRAAELATHLAEVFRAQGLRVLLLMDSLTRVAQAQREIGLAVGEPPTTKGYPPSVFSSLPRLVERAGCLRGGGSITAFYTVLMEDDDLQDPVVDAARAVLDGHIVLSRAMAERGIFPAIDLGSSLSRVMGDLVSPEQMQHAQRFRELWERYDQQADLIELGAYKSGSDALTDEAIHKRARMQALLRQSEHEQFDQTASANELAGSIRR